MATPDPISEFLSAFAGDDARLAAAARRSEAALRLRLAEAEIDPLTGLLNRRGLSRAWNPSAVGVAFLDVVGLKAINQGQGYAAGDAALQAVATALRRSVRSNDLCARWGGDEFVVVLYARDGASADLDATAFLARVHRRLASAAPGVAVRGAVVPGGIDLPDGIARAQTALEQFQS